MSTAISNSRFPLAFIAAAAASLGTAWGASTYYVSPSGSDSNPGTQLSPFRQIRKGIAVGTAGDTVLVADGSYLGFDLSMTGTLSAPFTIRALGSAANVLPTTDRSDNRDTIHILFSSYVVVDGLTSFNANRAAVRIDQSDHVTVRNGVFGKNATWGIFTDFSDDLLLENNECYSSGTQHGIYVSNSGDRPVVRRNRVHDNAGCGIQLNADLSQGGDGLITGALIEDNVAWNNGTSGGAAINLDGVQSSIVRNNLLYNNHASGIACFQIDGAAGPTGMSIFNNTVDMASNGRWALLIKSSTGPNTVRNNIFYNQNASRGGIDYGDATDVANTDSDYSILDAVTPDDSTRDSRPVAARGTRPTRSCDAGRSLRERGGRRLSSQGRLAGDRARARPWPTSRTIWKAVRVRSARPMTSVATRLRRRRECHSSRSRPAGSSIRATPMGRSAARRWWQEPSGHSR
jgi:parallel beta-helix repeat protein